MEKNNPSIEVPNLTMRQKWLPHLIILGLFIALTLGFLSPMMNGKVLQQHDEQMFSGSAKELHDYNAKTGKKAYWTNSMFGGMPAYQISVSYPKSMFLFNYIYKAFTSIPHPINTLLIYLISFYLMLLSFRVNPWVAAIGAVAFAFGSYNIVIIDAGHVNKTYAIAFAPFVVAAANYLFTSRKWLLGSALFGIAFALEIKCNHIQITYYLSILLGFLILFHLVEALKDKKLSTFLVGMVFLVVSGVLGGAANFSNLYLTNEYVKNTQRGKAELKPIPSAKDKFQEKAEPETAKGDGLDKDYALAWSQGVNETFTYLIPDFVGGPSAGIADTKNGHPNALKKIENQELAQNLGGFDQYWGPQPVVGGPIYFGAIIIFLFVLGLIILEGNQRWWILGVVILSTMLSWGKNFMGFTDLFFNYFPLYNKFRSVSMILVIASIVIPLLAMLILQKILDQPEVLKQKRRGLIIAATATGGLCLIFWLLPSLAGDFLKPADQDRQQLMQAVTQQGGAEAANQFMNSQGAAFLDGLVEVRTIIMKSDAIRSFIFILLALGALFVYSLGRLKKELVIAIMAILILGDMISVGKRYLKNEDFKPKIKRQITFDPSATDQVILKDTSPNYRVLNLTLSWNNDASTSYFHKSIGGYHAAKLRRYQDLIDRSLSMDIQTKLSKNNLAACNALNMMNTKYIITNAENPQQGLIVNPYAMGNAWFVSNLVKTNSPDEEINQLDKIDIKNQAVIGNPFTAYIGAKTTFSKEGQIKETVYEPGHIKYTYSTSGEQFVVFSEVYYNPNINGDWHKGDWQSFIDGKPVDHIRCNYTLRGMVVPAGNHEIEFKFEPRSYDFAENISFVSSLLLLGLTIGGFLVEYRKRG